jgi:3-deoxy-D-manno-octulosonic-acid transferase
MARRIYTLLTCGLLLMAPGYLLWRARRQPEYLRHWRERYACYPRSPHPAAPLHESGAETPTFWLHAVSVGETRAAQPLIHLLRKRWPKAHILISHMTPTGRQAAAELFGDTVRSIYLPYDHPWLMRRFLRHFRPHLGLIMETELWPNLVTACQYQNIPLLLVNARLSEKSARGYARWPNLTRTTLQGLTGVLAQSTADAQRLTQLGAKQVSLSGNLKFDISPPADLLALGMRWRQSWPKRRVLLAASTRAGEEKLIFEAWQRLAPHDWLLIVVPRHPQRFDEVATLATTHGLRLARRSTNEDVASASVWLGDSMGELFAYYAACDIAFIGGSLLDFGSQNLIEACAVGVPLLIGPSTYNFAEAAQAALDCGAAERVNDADALMHAALRLAADPKLCSQRGDAGRVFAMAHRGAAQRTLACIETCLQKHTTVC